MKLLYQDQPCTLATMHQKERVISPCFKKILGCNIVVPNINTDLLGTFSGEVQRELSPLDCAKEKCYRGMANQNTRLGLASEGSFLPHPFIPLAVMNHEILFFRDENASFDLPLSKISMKTNFQGSTILNLEELLQFANRALFPSHALIVRPNIKIDPSIIYKGIQTFDDLHHAFMKCADASPDHQVWVETDMRAHMNPSRMKVIEELAGELAVRLNTRCPLCNTPGWGITKKEKGLPCSYCGCPTELFQAEIYGCCKCDHTHIVALERSLADPMNCLLCNP